MRITAQLIKAKDGYHLWSETFDRDLTDIFTIQEGIAKSVASALSIALGVGEGDLSAGGTRNFDAYDAYLAGNSLSRELTPEGTVQALELLEKAVTLDPNYAQAWSVLAFTYDTAANFFIAGQTNELYAKSRAAAARAAAAAPEAVASLRATGYVQMRNRGWLEAEQSFRKALELAPGDFEANLYYGMFLMSVGRPGEARANFRQAFSTEPLLSLPVTQLGLTHELQGEFDKALTDYERAADLIGNKTFIQLFIAVLGMEMGDRVRLKGALEQALAGANVPDQTATLNGVMLSSLDSPDAAKTELRRMSEDPAFDLPLLRAGIAVWASYIGDHDLALETYNKIFGAGELQGFPLWRPLEKETRILHGFKDMLRNIGLVDYWRETGDWGEFCRPLGHDDDFVCE